MSPVLYNILYYIFFKYMHICATFIYILFLEISPKKF